MTRWHVARAAILAAVLAALAGLTATWAASAVFDALGPSRQSKSQTVSPVERPLPSHQSASPRTAAPGLV